MTGPATVRHELDPGQVLVTSLADVELTGPSGVIWALDSPQINANLVTLRPGGEIGEHINDEVDVLILIESGSGEVVIDGHTSSLGATSVALIPRGSTRLVRSSSGLVYYSIHQRRAGLSPSLSSRSSRPAGPSGGS